MTVTLKPYIVRFSPDYDQAEHGQPRDVVQLGGVAGGLHCHCHSCGEPIGPGLALCHRGRNLRGGTFEKVYHAAHYFTGG